MAGNGESGGGRRRNLWRPALWGTIALLLLTPLVAMRFTDEVRWTGSDFVVMGVLLGSAGLGLELTMRRSGSLAHRAAAGGAILASFLLVWVNLAVGFLGDESNPANLMFLGVLAVALAGSILARFRPAGMARAMAATAAAQILVGAIALTAGLGSPGAAGPYEVAMGTSLFVTLWLIPAWLFRKGGGSATVAAAA